MVTATQSQQNRTRTAQRNGHTIRNGRVFHKYGSYSLNKINKANRTSKTAAPAPQPRFSPEEAAAIERKVKAWEKLKESAAKSYGEMCGLEEKMIDLLGDKKSATLPDGRTVVALDVWRSPLGSGEVYTDHIMILPAGVLPVPAGSLSSSGELSGGSPQ